MPSSFLDKQKLRRLMKKMRNEHPASERMKKSVAISEKLADSEVFKRAKTVLFYYPKADEVDTRAVIDAALKMEKTVCLPCTDKKTRTISAFQISGFDTLRPATFGILEPEKDTLKAVAPEKIDLIIVPGIAFDEHGNRVGHGLGYYDKFLAGAKNAKKVGLAFDFQVVGKKIVCQSHDMTVDQIITEKRHVVIRK
jgi:5-formyltetrahydrofolate cyclo-ligase